MAISRRTVVDQEHTDGPEIATEKSSKDKENMSQDRSSIALLLLLYVLQGIPLGLAGSIPLILQSRNVAYKDQAIFSFAFWPFSVKLLWAPIVDSVFSRRVGRRKTWLIPTQYLIGLFLIVLSQVKAHLPRSTLLLQGGGGGVSSIPLTMHLRCLKLISTTLGG
jgi:PAT family acetyl-CoA transporter-like MFS transporter 1